MKEYLVLVSAEDYISVEARNEKEAHEKAIEQFEFNHPKYDTTIMEVVDLWPEDEPKQLSLFSPDVCS